MTDRLLTISEAEKLTGKSRSTLRRFIDGIVKAEKSADRHLLTPTPEDAMMLREQNQPFSWKISEQLLRRQFLPPDAADAAEGEKGSGGAPGSDSSRLVTVLEKSIAILERELAEKNNQISAMNDRLRESNILQKDLQSRLALPPGKPADVQTMGESRHEPGASAHAARESTEPKKRRFGWLFGA